MQSCLALLRQQSWPIVKSHGTNGSGAGRVGVPSGCLEAEYAVEAWQGGLARWLSTFSCGHWPCRGLITLEGPLYESCQLSPQFCTAHPPTPHMRHIKATEAQQGLCRTCYLVAAFGNKIHRGDLKRSPLISHSPNLVLHPSLNSP